MRFDSESSRRCLWTLGVMSKLVRLDKYLVDNKLAESRTQAQSLIEEGRVAVNGQRVLKPASQVSAGSSVRIDTPEKQWVSRGAYKLIKALDYFRISPSGKVCVDIGASTGGFTDVLLSRGAAKVYAIDVGYGQLAWKLREDPRVVVMERTNARHLTIEMLNNEKADIIVSDASFISQKLLLGAAALLQKPDGVMVILVKPQFEVGKDRVGKGVVTDPALHLEVLRDIAVYAENNAGLTLIDATFSPIRGPEGNIEFLFEFMLSENCHKKPEIDFVRIIEEAHIETKSHHSD